MLDLNLSPAQLRRIADILETNSDQPGFDFYSALAAMEAEDLGTSADNPDSVKPPECEVLRTLLADWFEAALFRISEVGHSADWQELIDDAKARHAALRVPWSNTFVPEYVREIMALDSDEPLNT